MAMYSMDFVSRFFLLPVRFGHRKFGWALQLPRPYTRLDSQLCIDLYYLRTIRVGWLCFPKGPFPKAVCLFNSLFSYMVHWHVVFVCLFRSDWRRIWKHRSIYKGHYIDCPRCNGCLYGFREI